MADGKTATSPGPPEARGSGPMAVLDAFRRLHAAGGALLTQAMLHGQLARVEWAQERSRMLKMLAVTLLGFAGLLCALLFTGALILALAWDSGYRIPALLALVLAYGLATGIAWRRLRTLSAQGEYSFAETREQLSADLALIRSER